MIVSASEASAAQAELSASQLKVIALESRAEQLQHEVESEARNVAKKQEQVQALQLQVQQEMQRAESITRQVDELQLQLERERRLTRQATEDKANFVAEASQKLKLVSIEHENEATQSRARLDDVVHQLKAAQEALAVATEQAKAQEKASEIALASAEESWSARFHDSQNSHQRQVSLLPIFSSKPLCASTFWPPLSLIKM